MDDPQERLAIQGEPPLERPKFEFLHNADILAGLRPIEWRIQDIMTDSCFFYSFGESGHYKTFVELDRGLCIAAGIDYHGHRVKQGTVFYIAGEGQQGLGRRIAAWHAAHKTRAADVPFFVARVPTQLMDPGAVKEVRIAVDHLARTYGAPAVVLMDTLARNFGDGDENATKDMNRVIANMDQAFGNDFCRGLIHHTGHLNKDRARGAYALHAAADIAYRISLTACGQVLVECRKMKDAAPAPPLLFDRVEIGLRIEDAEEASCVLDFSAEGDDALEAAKADQPVTVRGRSKSEALDILRGLYGECRINLVESGRPNAHPHVTLKGWREACFSKGLFSARKSNFDRAASNLLKDKLITYDKHGVHVYLSGQFEQNEQF